MNFNGKTLIIIGSILFFFQLGNFFSVDTISPAFERAQVLSAISSIIIILIGFLFEQFNTNLGDRVELKGENKFIFDSDIPTEILEELDIPSDLPKAFVSGDQSEYYENIR